MADVHAVLELRRFDPHVDREARWERVEVTLPEGSTVLEALMHIQDDLDGSLAFRRSCRHAICGSCGMRINGCARLACNTQVSVAAEQARRMAAAGQEASAAIRIEPLANMPVIKDLVADMSAFWNKLARVQPWLQSLRAADPDHERLMSPKDWAAIADGVLCLECGCCYSDCCSVEESEEFIGPTALAKAYRYAFDVRDDQTHRRVFDLSDEHGLWECTRCYTCTQRCPKHLRVRELITRLDQLAWGEGLRSDPGARRSAAVLDAVLESGHLDERGLPVRVEGIVKALSEAPAAALAGALPPHGPAPVDHLEDVRTVADAARKQT